MSQKSYKNLIAWQKAMELVTAIYDAKQGFPSHEQQRTYLDNEPY